MTFLEKKIETAANIAIIFVAVVIGVVLLRQYYFTTRPTSAPAVPIGKKLSLPEVDWEKNGKTLLIALQEGCIYCSQSAPFYQKLFDQTSSKKIPVIITLPQSIEAAQNYLK